MSVHASVESGHPFFESHPPMVEIGAKMRRVRDQRGLSQGQVARMIGVTKQTVSGWEIGRGPPAIESILKFARVMRIPSDELFKNLLPDLEPFVSVEDANHLVPVFSLDEAGDILMHEPKEMPTADRHVRVIGERPERAVAFAIVGDAMTPRFHSGDVVTLAPRGTAGRGEYVLAHAGGRYVFRRFLPVDDGGKVEGAILRALNDAYPDVVMGKKDKILARMEEHVSRTHT